MFQLRAQAALKLHIGPMLTEDFIELLLRERRGFLFGRVNSIKIFRFDHKQSEWNDGLASKLVIPNFSRRPASVSALGLVAVLFSPFG